MTEKQYNYYADRLSKANELKSKIIDAERMIKNLELGDRIGVLVGSINVQQCLTTKEIANIRRIIASHYQQVLEDSKKKLEDL